MQLEQFPRPLHDTRISYRLDLTAGVGGAEARATLERAHELGATWVTLPTSTERPLSEENLRRATELGLEPVVWIDARPARSVDLSDFATLCRRYARAGVNYLCVFDRPNTARVWLYDEWRQPGLPGRFAALLVPLLETIHANGLCPVLAPLAPNGHYWDLTFLAQVIGTLARESRRGWLDRLTLGVVDVQGRWGLGDGHEESENPARPSPYSRTGTMPRSALKTTRWYDALAREHLGRSLPLLSLDAVSPVDLSDDGARGRQVTVVTERPGDVRDQITRGLLPEYRLNISFGALANVETGADSAATVVEPSIATARPVAGVNRSLPFAGATIDHYILLCPSDSPEGERWSLTGLMGAILPYVGRFRPAIGFSAEEAAAAARVTIVGPDAEQLRQVERQLADAGRHAEAIPAASVNELKRIMVELASRQARFVRLSD